MSGPKKTGPLEITVTGATILQWPVMGTITSAYGADVNGKSNDGIDIEVAEDTPVVASGGGRVVYAGPSEQYGNLVIIAHNDVNHAAYGNLKSIDIEVGDTIERDQVIGIAGVPEDTGTPTLHFELRLGPDHASIDPVEVLGEMIPTTPALTTTYTVQSGDTLTDIAKAHYGLTDDAANIGAVQNAMNHIASLNPFLAEGVRANHIQIGEEFTLPDAATLADEPAIKLDHQALDRDMQRAHLIHGNFAKIDGGEPIILSRKVEAAETEITLGVTGNLTKTIRAAASQFDITLTAAQAFALANKVADANHIDNPDIVQAGQQIHFTRNMFGADGPA